jgi:putative oxidoreductase
MKYVVLVGRILFSFIFVMAIIGHFSKQDVSYAIAAGVPLASIAVPVSGIIAILGGLSIALGFKAKWGAWLIVLFLIPVTLMLHNFWTANDNIAAQMQMAMFIKNISLLGAALIIAYFGTGPLSLDSLLDNKSNKFGRISVVTEKCANDKKLVINLQKYIFSFYVRIII